MKLIGGLSWWEEHPAWVLAALSSLTRVGVDHVVCVDGAYGLMPEGTPRSASGQHAVITEVCHGLGLGLTLHVPTRTWEGNEVEKRTHMFELAMLEAEPDVDWLMIIDADSTIIKDHRHLKAELERTDLDVATVVLVEQLRPEDAPGLAKDTLPLTKTDTLRCLFRAADGLHVERNHYTYVTGDGRFYWGTESDPLVDALPTDVVMEHRTQLRPRARKDRQNTYYRIRDQAQVEANQTACHRCGKPASLNVPANLERSGANLISAHVPACDGCARVLRIQVDAQARLLGHDPATLVRMT